MEQARLEDLSIEADDSVGQLKVNISLNQDRLQKLERQMKSKIMMDEQKLDGKRQIETMEAEILDLNLKLRERRLEAGRVQEQPIVQSRLDEANVEMENQLLITRH